MEVNTHYMLEEKCTGLGIANMKPKYPQYSVITKRHDSFSTWPRHLPVSADELAECGFVYTGDSSFKGQDLCEILLDAEEEEGSRGSTNVTDCVSAPAGTADTTALTQSAHATAGTETAHATVGTGPEQEPDNRSMEELYEENQRLKDSQLCKICLDGPASLIFLPCGHMATCPQCAPAFSTCPIYRLRVHGFVKAYFVCS